MGAQEIGNAKKVLIEVRNLVAHYGTTKVLEDISFDVHEGEVFVIIGGSGCGKSTLLKHMCGLLTPTEGEVNYGEKNMAILDEEERAQIQRNIGIAFQNSGLLNAMTVGDNVALPLREYGAVDEAMIDPLVRMKLSLVGLAASQHLLPDELSGGMRKRAGLARALALDPPIIYFDEPSAGLDPIMASGLDELILRLRRLLGITFVIVTHELESIRSIADTILMLDRGKAVFLGPLEEAETTAPERVRQFFDRRPDDFIGQRNIE
jgi:phospholipid/cholesterol/gamma-HCH transport system ATP-binding protein